MIGVKCRAEIAGLHTSQGRNSLEYLITEVYLSWPEDLLREAATGSSPVTSVIRVSKFDLIFRGVAQLGRAPA